MKRLLEGQQLQRTVPPTAGRVEPVVRLPGGLTLDDRSCWQYPTMLVGNVGSGKSTLMEQIRRPVLAHADRVQDTVVIFAAKPDVLRCRRPGDPVISVSATDPANCWNLFRELDASDTPELTLREIASALFAEQKKKTTQIFFPEAAQEIFYQTARFMRDFGRTNNIPVSNAELSEFLTRTTVFAQEGAGTGTDGSWQELVERYPTYFSAARDLIGDGGAQGLGVLSEVRTMLSRLFIGSFNTADGRFSALQAIRQGGKRVFILYEPDKARTALPLFRLLLDLMLQQSMSPTLNHKVWFLLDEFSLLPKVESLTDFLSFARDPSGDNGRSGARIIAAVQSVQLLTRHYSEAEAKTLMSLFPNLITMRVMDPMSRAAFADRYGTARVVYRYMGEGNRPVTTDCEQKVVTDADFSQLMKPGQALMSLPAVSPDPFIYDASGPDQERRNPCFVPFQPGHGTFLALPTTHADAENTRRKNIQDGGTTTASRLLAQARILPQEALVCGPPGRIFPVVEALQRQSSRPFVLIGTARDLTDSPLLRLPVQWQDTVLPDQLPEGSGRITINPGEFGMGMMQMADWGGTHTILLCLGQGLSASTELLDALNACGDYVLLCSSLSRAVPSRTGGLTTEGLLRSMRYLVVSSAGGDARPCCRSCPATRVSG